MILHVSDIARNKMSKVKIKTNDTDVLVISVAFFHKIEGLDELWLEFGRKGNSFRYIPVHTIAHDLGEEKCRALLGFHAFTGCDSTSAFYGIGKKKPWLV